MWLVFWVVSNVTTGFYNLDLAPAFYKWGYAWPLHNSKQSLCFRPPPIQVENKSPLKRTTVVVEASHQILFDLHSRIGLNVGILVIWFVINSVLFAPACHLMRWEQQSAGKKAAKKEKEWMEAMSKQRSRLGLPK